MADRTIHNSQTPPRRSRLRHTLVRFALNALVIVVAVVTFFPIYWMLVSTFQPNEYTLRFPPPLFPKAITVRQFAELFLNHPLALWLRNSFIIATITMLICMILSVMGAYALSSLRWTGRNLFGLFLLVTQMLPEILVLIPIYGIYRRLDLLNNFFYQRMVFNNQQMGIKNFSMLCTQLI